MNAKPLTLMTSTSPGLRFEASHVDRVLLDARLALVRIELATIEQKHARAPRLRKERLDHATTDLAGAPKHRRREIFRH